MGRKPLPDDLKKARIVLWLTAKEEEAVRNYLQWLRNEAESIGDGG